MSHKSLIFRIETNKFGILHTVAVYLHYNRAHSGKITYLNFSLPMFCANGCIQKNYAL